MGEPSSISEYSKDEEIHLGGEFRVKGVVLASSPALGDRPSQRKNDQHEDTDSEKISEESAEILPRSSRRKKQKGRVVDSEDEDYDGDVQMQEDEDKNSVSDNREGLHRE